MEDLRTRIAQVLRDNIDYTGPDDYYGGIADAVIAELGLKIDRRKISYGVAPNGVINRDCHRWVTNWKADDE